MGSRLYAVARTIRAARTSVSSGTVGVARSSACSGRSGTCTKPPLTPGPLRESAHEDVEDVVAEETARIARGRSRDLLRAECVHDRVDGQRGAIGDRPARDDLAQARLARLVQALVEIEREALDLDVCAAVRLAEADDELRPLPFERTHELLRRTRPFDRQHRGCELGLRLGGERLHEPLRRVDVRSTERLEAGDEGAGHATSSSSPAASRAASRWGCSSTRTTQPSRM